MKTIVSTAFRKGIAIGLALAAAQTSPSDRKVSRVKNHEQSAIKRRSYQAIGHRVQTASTITP